MMALMLLQIEWKHQARTSQNNTHARPKAIQCSTLCGKTPFLPSTKAKCKLVIHCAQIGLQDCILIDHA